ncbi:MAG: hypothetical protein M3O35_16555 [Acidobacteriota bacterium]|nr:hypothetical protein [Acidobacteriota bacterium]
MKILKSALLFLVLQTLAFAADPALMSLMMPDARVIAGMQVDKTKDTFFGQFVLTHMQTSDAGFQKLMADSGFDPRRDFNEIVMASSWQQASDWLVAARGVFNPAKIFSTGLVNGGLRTSFQGVDILYTNDGKQPFAERTGVAFFDSGSAVMGTMDAVKAAIQRRQSHAAAGSSTLFDKAREVSAKNHFWFVSQVPVSEFADAMPDPNLGGAMKGNMLQAISQASGGVQFGATVKITGEAVTRSDKDAAALVDVARFLAGLVQTNRDKSKTAAGISTLLDGMEASSAGNVMTLSVAIPEAQLEQMIQTARAESKRAQAKPKKAPANQ